MNFMHLLRVNKRMALFLFDLNKNEKKNKRKNVETIMTELQEGMLNSETYSLVRKAPPSVKAYLQRLPENELKEKLVDVLK